MGEQLVHSSLKNLNFYQIVLRKLFAKVEKINIVGGCLKIWTKKSTLYYISWLFVQIKTSKEKMSGGKKVYKLAKDVNTKKKSTRKKKKVWWTLIQAVEVKLDFLYKTFILFKNMYSMKILVFSLHYKIRGGGKGLQPCLFGKRPSLLRVKTSNWKAPNAEKNLFALLHNIVFGKNWKQLQ